MGGTRETAIAIPGSTDAISFLVHANVAATPETTATIK
jgi:hypothetical protein